MVNNDNGYGKNEWMNGSTQKPKNQARKFFVFNCYSSIGTQNFFHSHFFRLCWHICSKTTKKKSGKKRMLFWLFLNYSFVCLFAISISLLDFFFRVRRFVIEHYRLIFLSIFVAIVVQVVVANFNLQVIFFSLKKFNKINNKQPPLYNDLNEQK